MLQFHKPLPPNQTEIYNSIKNYRCHLSSKNVTNQIFIATAKFKFPALFSPFFRYTETSYLLHLQILHNILQLPQCRKIRCSLHFSTAKGGAEVYRGKN